MLVKVAPIGERVTEVNVEAGSTVGNAISIAGVDVNGRNILLNNATADSNTAITTEGSIIALAGQMKGGSK